MCPLLALVETHTSTQVLLSGSMQFADKSDFYFFSPLLLKNLHMQTQFLPSKENR